MIAQHLLVATCSLFVTSAFAQTVTIDGQTVGTSIGSTSPSLPELGDHSHTKEVLLPG